MITPRWLEEMWWFLTLFVEGEPLQLPDMPYCCAETELLDKHCRCTLLSLDCRSCNE